MSGATTAGPAALAAGARLVPGLTVALLLLGGSCSSRGPAIPPEEDTPVHRACRQEARNSPEVRSIDRRANPLMDPAEQGLTNDKRLAENRAYRECLRRSGLTLRGGVEPVIPRR
jgi:hypothetical protein